MEISPWIRFLDLYRLNYDASPATNRLTAQPEYASLLEGTGVYLIADGGNLIYVGQAGGRSGGSSFGARVKKHGLKALGVTNETVPGCGIADTRRWSAYRARYRQTAQAQNLNGILNNWRVRMLVLPSQNEDQRRVIDLVEQVAALVFDRTRHAGEQAMELPPCNTQQLGASLLSWLAEHPPRVDEEPQLQLQPQDVMEVDLADEIVPVDDEGWYDEVFERRCDGRQELVQLYEDLLREIRAVSEEPMGQEVGLCVAYTDTNQRDLRVRGNFDGFAVLMRLTRRGNGFKVYVLLDPRRHEILDLRPCDEPNDRLKTSLQCGDAYEGQPGCDAERIGEVLRLALATAPRRRMPFSPRQRRPGLHGADMRRNMSVRSRPERIGASSMNEDLEQIPEGIDPLLDEAADVMVGGIQDAVNAVQRYPGEPDDDYVQRRNRAADQAVRDVAGGAWNTLPQGKPGPCLDRLIVTVHEDKDVIPRLIEALRHAERICPQTRLVMFVLMAPHQSWRAAWLAFREEFSRRCPQVALRVEVIGHPRLCFFDAWGRPVSRASDPQSGNGVQQWWQGANQPQKQLFRRRIRFLERLGIASRSSCKYIALHTDQPGGNFPDLSFGAYNIQGQNILQWSARIYLDTPHAALPIGFPRAILRAQVNPGDIVWGVAQQNSLGQPWCPDPNSMQLLESQPASFIDLTELTARLR